MPFEIWLKDLDHFFYVFARVLGLVLGMPFLSQAELPGQFRALTCTVLAILFYPLVPDDYFPTGAQPIELFLRFLIEFSLGFFLGLIARFALAAVEFGGSIIGFSSGLSMATLFNPTQSTQSSIISVFLSMAAVTIFLVLDGHHYIFANFLATYKIFPPHWFVWGSPILPDFFKGILTMSQEFFIAGLKMSIPFLIMNSLLQIALGILGKLVPQIQVFFTSMTVQVIVVWVLLLLCTGEILLNYEKLTVSLYKLIGLDHG